mgnify:CR=1
MQIAVVDGEEFYLTKEKVLMNSYLWIKVTGRLAFFNQ